MIKQVIVIRKDLGMRKGKFSSQAGHGVSNIFFDRIINIDNKKMTIAINREMREWIESDLRTKITLRVESLDELLELHNQAIKKGLPVHLVQDFGKTEFHGEKTYTALTIGPAKANEIDKITGHLPLF